MLKNNARPILNAATNVRDYCNAAVIHAFLNTNSMLRTAAGQDIVAFLGILEPRGWPECLMQLVGMLDSPTEDAQEVSISEFILNYDRSRAVSGLWGLYSTRPDATILNSGLGRTPALPHTRPLGA